MEKLRVVIVEDTISSAEALLHLLGAFSDLVKVVALFHCYESAVKGCNEMAFDLLFLDVELGNKTGFDVLKAINHRNFQVIITTSHQNYAIQAIRFSAIDFLLKPIGIEELKAGIDRVRESSTQQTKVQLEYLLKNISSSGEQKKKILLKTLDAIIMIRISDIIRCESDGGYTIFYIEEGIKHMVSRSLKEYEDMLVTYGFFRTHKSHLINMEHFSSFEKSEGGYVKMSDNELIPVSRRKKEALMFLLENL